jgi:succinate dehydrogenase / fumarate reductase, flavoprotein subunit
MDRFDRVRHSKGGNKPGEVRQQMQEAMQSHFSVFRRGDTLKEGLLLVAGFQPCQRGGT